jgi:hypothetical protein
MELLNDEREKIIPGQEKLSQTNNNYIHLYTETHKSRKSQKKMWLFRASLILIFREKKEKSSVSTLCVMGYWSMTSKRKRYGTNIVRPSSISNSLLRLTGFNSTHVKTFSDISL